LGESPPFTGIGNAPTSSAHHQAVRVRFLDHRGLALPIGALFVGESLPYRPPLFVSLLYRVP
jgi:hypothetical protein